MLRGWQTLCKVPESTIFVVHVVSLQLLYSVVVVQEQPWVSEYGCVPMGLFMDTEIWILYNFWVPQNIIILIFPNHWKYKSHF